MPLPVPPAIPAREPAAFQSSLLRTWSDEQAFLKGLDKKYAGTVGTAPLEEITADLAVVGALKRKYEDGSTGNVFLLSHVLPYYERLAWAVRRPAARNEPAAEHPQPATNCPPPATNYVPPTTREQPHTAHSTQHTDAQRQTSSHAPPTIHSKLQTPNPKLATDIGRQELQRIEQMDRAFDAALEDIVANRLDDTLTFGTSMHAGFLADYARALFGELLAGDSFLSIIQQYALADVPIVNAKGSIIGRTGFNLAFFGAPGTGKTFAIKEMILGNPDRNVPAHGLVGRNRYCGGMTSARFIRMGEAYTGRRFNFIVPEFNDWFASGRSSSATSMTDRLKLALEHGEVAYETNRETIGPYRFDSFFSVNYNTKTSTKTTGRGKNREKKDEYTVTIGDPNFEAIEDRMLCNLQVQSAARYEAVAASQARLAMGETDFSLAPQIQDHLMLVYAIQTGHPLVRETFPTRPVRVGNDFYDAMRRARESIIGQLRERTGDENPGVPFSSRLEYRALQLAAAMALPEYFSTTSEVGSATATIEISRPAYDSAVRFFATEAAVRSKGVVDVQYTLDAVQHAAE